MAAPLLSVCLFALLASLKLCNRRHCPFVALILLVPLIPFLNAVALSRSDFSFLFLMTMSLTTCPVSVIGHLSTLPLHAHYAIHLPFAFHALAHPCFCPLLSTSLLLPTTLLWQASELNFCLSLLPPSILLIYSGSSSLKLILNISVFPFWFLLLDEKNIIIIKNCSHCSNTHTARIHTNLLSSLSPMFTQARHSRTFTHLSLSIILSSRSVVYNYNRCSWFVLFVPCTRLKKRGRQLVHGNKICPFVWDLLRVCFSLS